MLDSFFDLNKVEEAMILLGKTSIMASQAAKAMKDLSNAKNIYAGFPKEEDNGVLYRKKQAAHWANKHSHKIRRKL